MPRNGDKIYLFRIVLELLVAAAAEVAFATVALRMAQALVVVRRFGVEGVPEQGEGLDQGILEVGSLLDLDLDLDHNLRVGHLGEVGHILQVDLDQAGNFLEAEHNLQVGGFLVGLGLNVNWEGAVGVVSGAVGHDWA
jgi:hypothetical protein